MATILKTLIILLISFINDFIKPRDDSFEIPQKDYF